MTVRESNMLVMSSVKANCMMNPKVPKMHPKGPKMHPKGPKMTVRETNMLSDESRQIA